MKVPVLSSRRRAKKIGSSLPDAKGPSNPQKSRANVTTTTKEAAPQLLLATMATADTPTQQDVPTGSIEEINCKIFRQSMDRDEWHDHSTPKKSRHLQRADTSGEILQLWTLVSTI